MALREAMRGSVGRKADYAFYGLRRWTNSAALPAPLQTTISSPITNKLPPSVLPENWSSSRTGLEVPNLPGGGGPMELMAVPKKKVSKHKRGIRNGPKALKPVPVIVRCTVCGRVKLPHFFCCSGIKPNPGEHSG